MQIHRQKREPFIRESGLTDNDYGSRNVAEDPILRSEAKLIRIVFLEHFRRCNARLYVTLPAFMPRRGKGDGE